MVVETKQLAGLSHVSLLTGIIFAAGVLASTLLIYFPYEANFFSESHNIVTFFSIPTLAFIMGMFVQGFRNFGFQYSVMIYKKNKQIREGQKANFTLMKKI